MWPSLCPWRALTLVGEGYIADHYNTQWPLGQHLTVSLLRTVIPSYNASHDSSDKSFWGGCHLGPGSDSFQQQLAPHVTSCSIIWSLASSPVPSSTRCLFCYHPMELLQRAISNHASVHFLILLLCLNYLLLSGSQEPCLPDASFPL